MMPDRASYCCWVEPLSDGDRWVFLSPTGAMYVGPNYDREESLADIEAILSRWRESGDDMQHHSQQMSSTPLDSVDE
jgi:hypothetical protein